MDAEVGHLKHFEHCQNIGDKYLVRGLRTPDFRVFFSLEIRKHTSLLMFLIRLIFAEY